MSELRVDSVKSKGGGAPDLPKGVTISGIATAATLGATTVDVSNVNVSGVVTSGTLSGSLLSTGTPTLGLGVTINSSGLVVSGVATVGIVSATTLYGDGTNLTGVGASIAPLFYNPDISDGSLDFTATGIGITFNSQVKAGTGNITLRLVGAAGTVVENFGVGSSVTVSENRVSFTPTASLASDTVYHINYPSGCLTNNEGTDYVGTAYTFDTRNLYNYLFSWGINQYGQLGQNNTTSYSSPVQVAGTTWKSVNTGPAGLNRPSILATKTDGTLWAWGYNNMGQLGLNNNAQYSSPVQIPGSWTDGFQGGLMSGAVNTDGELWVMGDNGDGGLAQNNRTQYSSPVQIPGTTWGTTTDKIHAGDRYFNLIKTDGTLWAVGQNDRGTLGQGSPGHKSSPVQIPGTTWSKIAGNFDSSYAIKTDGTLWAWGQNDGYGELGQNNKTQYNSPVQVPGTTWKEVDCGYHQTTAVKTDGTLWAWGYNFYGTLGQNNQTNYSSPVQIPGTTWNRCFSNLNSTLATKTDGTLWAWGRNNNGTFGNNSVATVSSPVQVPGTLWTSTMPMSASYYSMFVTVAEST